MPNKRRPKKVLDDSPWIDLGVDPKTVLYANYPPKSHIERYGLSESQVTKAISARQVYLLDKYGTFHSEIFVQTPSSEKSAQLKNIVSDLLSEFPDLKCEFGVRRENVEDSIKQALGESLGLNILAGNACLTKPSEYREPNLLSHIIACLVQEYDLDDAYRLVEDIVSEEAAENAVKNFLDCKIK